MFQMKVDTEFVFLVASEDMCKADKVSGAPAVDDESLDLCHSHRGVVGTHGGGITGGGAVLFDLQDDDDIDGGVLGAGGEAHENADFGGVVGLEDVVVGERLGDEAVLRSLQLKVGDDHRGWEGVGCWEGDGRG